MLKHSVAALVAVSVAAGAAIAQTAAPAHADYTVFVDPPTGFVFVKLPTGWKFAGRMEAQAGAPLPDHVLTWLLPPEEDRTRLAGAMPAGSAPAGSPRRE